MRTGIIFRNREATDFVLRDLPGAEQALTDSYDIVQACFLLRGRRSRRASQRRLRDGQADGLGGGQID